MSTTPTPKNQLLLLLVVLIILVAGVLLTRTIYLGDKQEKPKPIVDEKPKTVVTAVAVNGKDCHNLAVYNRFKFLEDDSIATATSYWHSQYPSTADIARQVVIEQKFPIKDWNVTDLQKLTQKQLDLAFYEHNIKMVINEQLDIVAIIKPQSFQEYREKRQKLASVENSIGIRVLSAFFTHYDIANHEKMISIMMIARNNAYAIFWRYYNDGILIKTYKDYHKKVTSKPRENYEGLMYFILNGEQDVESFKLMADSRIILFDYQRELNFQDDEENILKEIRYILYDVVDINLDYMNRIYHTLSLITENDAITKELKSILNKASKRCVIFAKLNPEAKEAWQKLEAKFLNLNQIR